MEGGGNEGRGMVGWRCNDTGCIRALPAMMIVGGVDAKIFGAEESDLSDLGCSTWSRFRSARPGGDVGISC